MSGLSAPPASTPNPKPDPDASPNVRPLSDRWIPYLNIKGRKLFVGRDGQHRGMVQRNQETQPRFKASFAPTNEETEHNTPEEAEEWVEEQYRLWEVERKLDGAP
jgi:hypothetical protein